MKLTKSQIAGLSKIVRQGHRMLLSNEKVETNKDGSASGEVNLVQLDKRRKRILDLATLFVGWRPIGREGLRELA